MANTPNISIALVGDPGVGKSTFLSRISLGTQINTSNSPELLSSSDHSLTLDVRLYNRPYKFELHEESDETASLDLSPDVLVLCFDIGNPSSLASLPARWRPVMNHLANLNEDLPVVVLGLKRDVRDSLVGSEGIDGGPGDDGSSGSEGGLNKDELVGLRDEVVMCEGRGRFVYPEEALRVAQSMRCDRYSECSALTGELCREAFEDITKTAALTTTSQGAKTQSGCVVV